MASEVSVERLNKKAVKMVMVYDDGSTTELEKGIIIGAPVDDPNNSDRQMVTMMGCNISGHDLIDLAITVLVPLVPDDYEGED